MAVSAPVLRHAQFYDGLSSPTLLVENVPLGSASESRAVIVAVAMTGGTVAQVDVGSVTATAAQVETGLHIYLAIAPTGTDADIEFSSAGGNFSQAYVAVYTCDGVDAESPVADDASSVTEIDTAGITLDVPAGGAVVAFGSSGFSSSDSNIIEWTGASEDDEFQQDFGGFFLGYAVASFATENAAPGHVIEIERQDTSFEFGSTLAGIALNPAPEGPPAGVLLYHHRHHNKAA